MIEKISIKNFRGIREIEFNASKFNLFIGDNGTSKTSILEAIHYAITPTFLSGRIKHTDFYNAEETSIEIVIKFSENIKVKLLDGYTPREIDCDKISLEIKKRERRASGKFFYDLITLEHLILPIFEKGEDGWKIKRKSGTEFKFDERLLSLSQIDSDDLYRSFYFSKDRERQIQKGFGSSFNTIINDLNWKFDKAIRNEQNSNEIIKKIESSENEIHKFIELDEQEFVKELKNKAENFGLEKADIHLIDIMSPYDNSFLSTKVGNILLPVKYLGSGIEMIYSLLFLETLASFSKEKLIILIDEPELHLHPKLQEKFADYLYNISQKHQIFLTTHSPIFFKSCINRDDVASFILKKSEQKLLIEEKKLDTGLFPWSPSWGEINYFAYDYPTIEFHDELYGYLQELSEKFKQNEFDEWLAQQKVEKNKKWKREMGGKVKREEDVTLPTFIRNKIHHPENKLMSNYDYTPEDLVNSIKNMIEILKALS